MFKKTIIRLTVGYLAGIMLLSAGFSVTLYKLSTRELGKFQRRQEQLFRRGFPELFPPPGFDSFEEERLHQLQDSRTQIMIQLLEFNVLILFLGGGASYLLARRTIRPIQESWESQTRFTADASHELRTPLAAMQTELEVALRDPRLAADEAKRLLVSNLEEVSKLTNLSNSLLKMAQVQGQKMEFKTIASETVVTAAISRIKKMADQKKMDIQAAGRTFSLQADGAMLTEALVVLLDNAVKYGDRGTVITVKSLAEHQHVIFAVSNHGPNIDRGDISNIFQRFYRADKSRNKSRTDGFGLGLALAKDIVTAHQGTIIVASQLGQPTTFEIRLPLKPENNHRSLSRWWQKNG